MPYKDKDFKTKYDKLYRLKNGRKIKDNINLWRKKQWTILRDYKKSLKCADCGFSGMNNPEVIDFDHIKGKKIKNINILRSTASFKKVMVEILKCEPVCANCHRIRTVKRYEKNGYPAILWRNKHILK